MYRVPNAIHSELLNWAAWCNLGAWPHPLPRTQCGSLEGDYRAPPEWDSDLEEAPPPPKIRPNERHARRMQEAWESLEGFPRLVLKSEYPGFDGGRADRAEKLRLTVQQYENHLQIAVNRVEAMFATCA